MWSMSSETLSKYSPCPALQKEVNIKSQKLKKTLEMNSAWCRAPFVLVLTVKKGPFINMWDRNKPRRTSHLYGVMSMSQELLYGLPYQLDFPTSGAGGALAGWPLCSSSWLCWDCRRRRKVALFRCWPWLSVCPCDVRHKVWLAAGVRELLSAPALSTRANIWPQRQPQLQ